MNLDSPAQDAHARLAAIVDEYRITTNLGALIDQIRLFAQQISVDQIAAATLPYRNMPEVVIPAYERITAECPTDAQALVVLANAYWLTGRGPEVVASLALRAIDLDPANRGAWHLW